MEISYNPWHGCHKISAGCANCYVYRMDAKHKRDSSIVAKTSSIYLPIAKNRQKSYKYPGGTLFATCFTSDFFVEEADAWRGEAWEMMRTRHDCNFLLITKRIHRFLDCIPPDWGQGYPNVAIYCTCENQQMADIRLPIYQKVPIATKVIICEPLLGPIDLRPYLGDWVQGVSVGGESGENARPCHFDWVLDIRDQCIEAGVPFTFRQTGANFVKDGVRYRILRQHQGKQARKAHIDT